MKLIIKEETTMSNILKIFTPYLNNCTFEVKKGDTPTEHCLNANVIHNYRNESEIVLYNDFFTPSVIINSKWSVSLDDSVIICISPNNERVEIKPCDLGTKSLPTVEWDKNLGFLNFVNEDLWERDLVREICGRTYYPLDLFRFKNRIEVLKSPEMQDLIRVLRFDKHRFLKTIYYYIDNDKSLCIGIWDYKMYMPLDPVRHQKVVE